MRLDGVAHKLSPSSAQIHRSQASQQEIEAEPAGAGIWRKTNSVRAGRPPRQWAGERRRMQWTTIFWLWVDSLPTSRRGLPNPGHIALSISHELDAD